MTEAKQSKRTFTRELLDNLPVILNTKLCSEQELNTREMKSVIIILMRLTIDLSEKVKALEKLAGQLKIEPTKVLKNDINLKGQ